MSIADKLTTIAENEPKVYEAGKAKERDEWWENFQNGGKRTAYNYAFYSMYWTDDIYHPKYPIYTKNANSMFDNSLITDTIVDVDVSGITITVGATFRNCKNLKTIRKFITKASAEYNANVFEDCSALENITIEGEIGRTITFQYSPLTVESMKSIISSLVNYAGTANESVYKVTFTESCWNTLEADSSSPSGGTWKDYVKSLGWLV